MKKLIGLLILTLFLFPSWGAAADSIKTIKAKSWVKEGLEYLSNHEYDQAIKAFTTAITFDPNLANAYNNRGNAYEKKNNHGPRRNHWFYS